MSGARPVSGASGAPPALHVDADELAACVSCGLCLAHCPTYRATGEEALSPRGRIAAMREVAGGAPGGRAFERMVATCVGCRACETACPSAVPFGHLLEGSRRTLAARAVPRWQRAGYRLLGSHRALLALSTVGALAQRAHLVPGRVSRRLSLPRLPLRRGRLTATGTEVWLFTGCVMDAWQRQVHHAAAALLGAMGTGMALPGPGAGCCGALHVHAGLHVEAVALARRVVASMPGDAPVLVDSAGCGAAMKDYGRLLPGGEGERFAARVLDVHEWLAARASSLPPPARPGAPLPLVAVQDPCHLRHVQRCEGPVRAVLAPYARLVELADEGRCCGAGGAYSALQPALARRIRVEKLAAVSATGADVVASANPGCAMWLAAAGLEVRHPLEIAAAGAGLLGEA